MQPSPFHRRPAIAIAALGAVCGCVLAPGDLPTAPTTSTAPTAVRGADKAAPPFAPNWVTEPRRFATGVRITAFAATPTRLLGATVGPAPTKLVSFGEDGAWSAFAPELVLPAAQPCGLDRAPGVGAFAFDAVLVGCGSEIWQLDDEGSIVQSLATLPHEDGAIVQLCFDTVGHFDFDVVVLCTSGGLFRVGASGLVERIGDAGPEARGIAIATPRFSAFAGQVLVATASDVRAMNSAGHWRSVTRWSGITGVWSIPDNPRAFGSSTGALFLATEAGEVHRCALQDLAARGGQVVLTTEHASGSGLIVPQGNGWTTRPFSRFVGRETGAGVVRLPAVQRVQVDAPAEVVTQGPDALIPVAVLSGVGFDAASLEGAVATFAGAAPVPYRRDRTSTRADVNGDGVVDLVYQFRVSELDLPLGECRAQFEATTFGGQCVRGSDRVLVVTPAIPLAPTAPSTPALTNPRPCGSTSS